MRLFSKLFFITACLYAFGVILYIANSQPSIAKAATDNSTVVISQIQVSGTGNAHQEFVELYNPTTSDIDLTNWELAKKNGNR